jgi:hypothetical protein
MRFEAFDSAGRALSKLPNMNHTGRPEVPQTQMGPQNGGPCSIFRFSRKPLGFQFSKFRADRQVNWASDGHARSEYSHSIPGGRGEACDLFTLTPHPKSWGDPFGGKLWPIVSSTWPQGLVLFG